MHTQKNESPQARTNAMGAKTVTSYWNTTRSEQFRPSPLLPPNDATPIPEDYWLVHRWRKGGRL